MTEARSGGSRRPWLVVGLWLIVILTAFVLVAMLLAFEGEAEITKTTVERANRILDEGFPQEAANGQAISEVVVLRAEDGELERLRRARARVSRNELRAAGAAVVVTASTSDASCRRTGTRLSSSLGSVATVKTTWMAWSRRFSGSTTSPDMRRR